MRNGKPIFILAACVFFSQALHAQGPIASSSDSQKVSPFKTSSVSGKHAMLQQVIQVTGMAGVLQNSSGFTIFAPTDTAFTRLSKTTLNALLDPENVSSLKSVMANHVVRGSLSLDEIRQAVAKGDGEATFATISGEQLVFRTSDKGLTLTDWRGRTARISNADFHEGKNTVYAIDRILL